MKFPTGSLIVYHSLISISHVLGWRLKFALALFHIAREFESQICIIELEESLVGCKTICEYEMHLQNKV